MTEILCIPSLKSGFCGFRGSGSHKGNPSTRGHSKSTTEISLLPGHFMLFLPRYLMARKGTTILAEIIDPDHQEEGREEYHDIQVTHLGASDTPVPNFPCKRTLA